MEAHERSDVRYTPYNSAKQALISVASLASRVLGAVQFFQNVFFFGEDGGGGGG